MDKIQASDNRDIVLICTSEVFLGLDGFGFFWVYLGFLVGFFYLLVRKKLRYM